MQIRWGKPPRVRQLADSGWELSRVAARRLQWMTHYLQHGRNAAFTCHHFGISRQTFYRWSRRYDPHHLASLQGHAHRPHRLRQPTGTAAQAEAVLALRREYPRWGKDKLVVLLRRNHLPLSTSLVGRILSDLKRRGVLVEPPSQGTERRRRKLRGRPWATRKPCFWPIQQPGDLVQLDTKELRPARGVVLACPSRLPRCRSTAAASSLPKSSWLANNEACRSSCSHHARPNSTVRSNALIARTTRSSARWSRRTGMSGILIPSSGAGNTSTTPCALIRRCGISLRSNSSSAGNLNRRKLSVTNHVDEYNPLTLRGRFI